MADYGDNKRQEGDVFLYQTVDGGDINVTSGIAQMTVGFETMAYLSLFGGNADDPGLDDTRLQWWGNFDETDAAFQYRSQTQYLLRSIPATSANLIRVQDAVTADLSHDFIATGIAGAVNVEVSIPRLNAVQIDIRIEADGEISEFTFFENWRAAI